MAVRVGVLQVDLVANTASFTGPLDKAGQSARKSSKDIQGAFNGMDFSDARGGLILIDELVGIHIPRHAAAFASQLPGLMQIAAAAMPVAAFAAIGVAIFNATEKGKEHEEELRKQAIESVATADAVHKHALALEIENLKLEDSIRTLEKLPKQNGVAIAAKQAEQALQNLREEFNQVIAKQLALFSSDTKGLFMTGFWESFDDKNYKVRQSAEGMVNYFHDIQELETKATIAAKELRHTDAEDFKRQLKVKTDAMLEMARIDMGNLETGDDAQRRYATKLRALLVTFGELKNVQDAVARGNKDAGTAADLSGAIDAYSRVETNAKQSLSVQLAGIEELKATAVESFTSMGMAFDQAKSKADDMFSAATLQANLDYFAKLSAAAATHADKVKVASEQEIFLDQQTAATKTHLAETEAKTSSLIDQLNTQSFKNSQQFNEQTQKQQMGNAAARTKALIDEIGLKRGMTDEEARIAALQEVHSFQRIKDLRTELAALENIRKETLRLGQDTTAVDAAIHTLQQKRLADYANELMATGRLKDAMHGTMLQMINDGQQWQHKVGDVFKSTVDGMNKEMASFLVTGKANWRQLAATAIESIVEIGLQYIESKLLMMVTDKLFGETEQQKAATDITLNVARAFSAAGLAGANTMAVASLIDPFGAAELAAINYGIAASFASLAAFRKGGIVPFDMVAQVHQDEMVLPAHVSNAVLNFANNGGSGGGDTNHHYQIVYAPKVSAIDSTGVAGMLNTHRDLFFREFRNHIRRMNHA